MLARMVSKEWIGQCRLDLRVRSKLALEHLVYLGQDVSFVIGHSHTGSHLACCSYDSHIAPKWALTSLLPHLSSQRGLLWLFSHVWPCQSPLSEEL